MLTFPVVFCISFRAQKRIAQQRLESKVPLQQLNDIRKRVFNEVKVSMTWLLKLHIFLIAIAAVRKLGLADWRRTTYLYGEIFSKQPDIGYGELVR